MSMLAPLHTPRELERLVSNPIDPEYEAWWAARRRYVLHKGEVVPVKTVGGGSFLTGTQTELIYANVNPGTAKTTFTTEAVPLLNDATGMGQQPFLPPFFWSPGGNLSAGRGLRITARGIYSTTAAPTWQLFCRLGSAAASVAGSNIGSTAATALGSTQTNLLWEFEEDAIMTVLGVGPPGTANSTIRGLGFLTAALTVSTSTSLAIFGGGASPGTVATVDPSVTNYLSISAACGTSSASNSIQLLQLLVQGLN